MTTEAPELTVDPLAAHQEVSRRVRTIRDIRRQLAIIEATYHDQIVEVEESLGNVYRLAIQEVDLWWAQERERLDHDIAHQEACIRPLVALLVAEEPSKRKSVSTVAGVAGFRSSGKGRVKVEDRAQAVAWLRQHGRETCVRVPEPEVAVDAVREAFIIKGDRFQTQDGECIPGLLIEGGGDDDKFYVETTEAPR